MRRGVVLVWAGLGWWRGAGWPMPGCIPGWKRPSGTKPLSKRNHWSAACGYEHTSLHTCQFRAAYDCASSSVFEGPETVAGATRILVYYGGQLGNNMFQYAFARKMAASLRNRSRAVAVTTRAAPDVPRWARMTDTIDPPGTRLPACGAGAALVTDRDGLAGRPMCAQLRAALGGASPAPCIRVDGFFQDYRAVSGDRDGLIEAFSPTSDECGHQAPEPTEIVVHVRVCGVGPVVNWGACYGDMPYEYYATVLRTMLEATPGAKVTVLSPPDCAGSSSSSKKSALLAKLEADFGAKRASLVSKGGASDGRADFCYMTRAKRLVLQPSTFGWWAAWLSNATEIHYPLLGLFAHQRTLNYPHGPGRTPKAGLKCDAIFRPPGGVAKSLVVPESRYSYHDVLGGRYFGTYDADAETFAFRLSSLPKDTTGDEEEFTASSSSPGSRAFSSSAAAESSMSAAEAAFCRPPKERTFHATPRIIGLGPRSIQLACFARWTETNLRDLFSPEAIEAKEKACCGDAMKTSKAARAPILVFPRSHVHAAMHLSGGNLLLANGNATRLRELADRRRVDFNFVGRVVSKQAAVTRARKWVVEFAKVHFTNRSQYLDTTAKHRPYTPLGPWDKSASNPGFLPMDAMSQRHLNRCAMAKCDQTYYATLAASRFTLAPAGDQPWSQRFFEAVLAASVPVVLSPEHTGRSTAEKKLGYHYLLAPEFAARLKTFRATAGPHAPLPYCSNLAMHNLDIFLKRQTAIARRQTIDPSLRLCDSEAFLN